MNVHVCNVDIHVLKFYYDVISLQMVECAVLHIHVCTYFAQELFHSLHLYIFFNGFKPHMVQWIGIYKSTVFPLVHLQWNPSNHD